MEAYGVQLRVIGTRFVLYREVSFIRKLKCTGIIGVELSFIERCPLFGVSFIGGSTVNTLW